MKKIVDYLLASCKWYRRLRGGKWYKLCDEYAQSGFASPIPFWSNKPPEPGHVIMAEESYNSQQETDDEFLDRQW